MRISLIAYSDNDVAPIIKARKEAALEYLTADNEKDREAALAAVEYYDALLIQFLNLATSNG